MRIWLYGRHACLAALANKNRVIHRVCLTPDFKAGDLPPTLRLRPEITAKKDIESLLSQGALHQGIAVQASPLAQPALGWLAKLKHPRQCVIILDQVSDPHNIGAIMRSMAVFGATALITPQRNTCAETGTLVKTASGAFERIPWISVNNLSQALGELKDNGFWCYGLSEQGEKLLSDIDLGGKVALILGSEGQGMRRLTGQGCDLLVRLPAVGSFSTLNVSNAAAVSLYAWSASAGS